MRQTYEFVLRRWGFVFASATLVLILAGLSCNGKEPSAPETPPVSTGGNPDTAAVVPDFHLLDVNPNSTTYDSTVSPRDHLGQISAWYFGHAT